MNLASRMMLGAAYLEGGRCRFRVWAPGARIDLRLITPRDRLVRMEPSGNGYHEADVDGVEPGTLYRYQLDGSKERPDPASRLQPEGVHGPSQVLEPHFPWSDSSWHGLPLTDHIIYELHTGTYTPEGTFEAIIPHIDGLKDLGITAIELMPIAQFPGGRNWGYDGVFPFAAQNTYGGPQGLKRLVDSCHRKGIAVVLDVVYNHLGPEGNYFRDFGPYFTDRYRTPWGEAINYDGPWSDEVRRFFIENALYWTMECHIDALRLDALHEITDQSASGFIPELARRVHGAGEDLNRHIHLFAESNQNKAALVRPRELGGCALDGYWNDDYHHAVHTILTGEKMGYYADYGDIDDLAKALQQGFVYSGQYSAVRNCRYGESSRDVPARRFAVFSQNHDQIGNRMMGERLSQLVSLEGLKLAAGIVFLSPFVPLLFMGEEYGERAPFLYFISHSDPELVDAVRRGRKEEFSSFLWTGEPPDPFDESTFLRSKLDHSLPLQGHHRLLRDFYKELIRLRKETPALARLSKDDLDVSVSQQGEKWLWFRRWKDGSEALAAFNFAEEPVHAVVRVSAGHWHKALDSADESWGGTGSKTPSQLEQGVIRLMLNPWTFVLYLHREE